jgi:hypothetical protein
LGLFVRFCATEEQVLFHQKKKKKKKRLIADQGDFESTGSGPTGTENDFIPQ